MNIIKETIDNDAYMLSCKCPNCLHTLSRSYEENTFFCRYCGSHLYAPAFSDEAIRDALLRKELDDYEN